jgi:hypothetical protein
MPDLLFAPTEVRRPARATRTATTREALRTQRLDPAYLKDGETLPAEGGATDARPDPAQSGRGRRTDRWQRPDQSD